MHASFVLSPMFKVVYLFEYLIPPTSMPEVVEMGSCPIFLPIELESLICMSRDRIRVTYMNVQVTHTNAMFNVSYSIPNKT